MTGILLDSVLMLLLVVALGYGVRLEKKLTALRAGQLAFAGAVTELNAAAGRAENALGSLRDASEEADMLHDRILKARTVKQELEVLIARAPSRTHSPSPEVGRDVEPQARPGAEVLTRRAASDSPTRTEAAPRPSLPIKGRAMIASESSDDDRTLRMAALAERIQGMASPKAPGRDNVSAILGALNAGRANHARQHSPNRPRTTLDDDLFAA